VKNLSIPKFPNSQLEHFSWELGPATIEKLVSTLSGPIVYATALVDALARAASGFKVQGAGDSVRRNVGRTNAVL
jgi:hypothetical protein